MAQLVVEGVFQRFESISLHLDYRRSAPFQRRVRAKVLENFAAHLVNLGWRSEWWYDAIGTAGVRLTPPGQTPMTIRPCPPRRKFRRA